MKKSKWRFIGIVYLALSSIFFFSNCGSDSDPSDPNDPNPSVSCGDSKVDTGESCDDGNLINGDGCESNCTVTLNFCGNGILENEEICDDGNNENGDGCETNCSLSQKSVAYEETQLGLEIEDNTEFGYECVQFEIPNDNFNKLLKVELTVGIDHPFSGDLQIRLDSSIATTDYNYIIIYPVSNTSANLSSNSEITFSEDAEVSAENLASSLGDNEIACQDDGICNYIPFPPMGNFYTGYQSLSNFIGENTVGKWSVCVGDRQANNIGTLETVRLTLTKEYNTAYCGNGILEPEAGEECDDGNNEDEDSCEHDCDLPN